MITGHALIAMREKVSIIKKTAGAVIERGGQDLTDGMKQILALAEEVDGDLWALIDAADGIPPDPEDAAG